MITKPRVMPLVLDARPSFRPVWEGCVGDGDEVLYVLLRELASHLRDLPQAERLEVFPRVAQVIAGFGARVSLFHAGRSGRGVPERLCSL